MIRHQYITTNELHRLLKDGEIAFAGNHRLKIYGLLNCRSGKRMKRGHRVFFKDEAEAISSGFRPCGHCMRESYLSWRDARKSPKRTDRKEPGKRFRKNKQRRL
ncbi:MAG: Ada metal-binding domain-containing protein [Bacteroidota bacterium]